MSSLALYTDPLVSLLKDPNLNKEKDKSQELIRHINSINDEEIKSWCIEAFEILKDLETLELKIKNWEFHALEFNVSQSLILGEEDQRKRAFNSKLAQRVAKNCLDLHRSLQDLGVEINELNGLAKFMSPRQRISDPGTILTELMLRAIKLKSLLLDEVSIRYSKAKLVKIGMDLESIMYQDDEGNYDDITEDTVVNYKQFINTLLQQINDCISTGDTIGALECVSVVTDVERMFEAMKKDKLDRNKENLLTGPDLSAEKMSTSAGSESSTSTSNSDTLCGDEPAKEVELPRKKSTAERSSNFQSTALYSPLYKTTLAENMPYLMHAFEEARNVEEDLKDVMEASDLKHEKRRKPTAPTKLEVYPGLSSMKREFPLNQQLPVFSLSPFMKPNRQIVIGRVGLQKNETPAGQPTKFRKSSQTVPKSVQNFSFRDIDNLID
ncbi:hypothetical protein OGAPHI_002273 [Ogataea philodendri]|uniref:Uncharacterized protein n=1 Tax=Ogataea philodendri TaxID=1378263 RepID=A0A9P8PC41_9ASCO|nr:uncharacterized protein OGAPHI_002273 [Ogataea philodendri]KAH3668519.1 hypothetical protein OGAPHI_002273 [Ogataea philodendri]